MNEPPPRFPPWEGYSAGTPPNPVPFPTLEPTPAGASTPSESMASETAFPPPISYVPAPPVQGQPFAAQPFPVPPGSSWPSGPFGSSPMLPLLPRADWGNYSPQSLEPAGPLHVVVDLACTGCGYNLKTLMSDARCPECGQPVEKSLISLPECYHVGQALGLCRSAFFVFLVGYCLGILCCGLGWPVQYAARIMLSMANYRLMRRCKFAETVDLAPLTQSGWWLALCSLGLSLVGVLLVFFAFVLVFMSFTSGGGKLSSVDTILIIFLAGSGSMLLGELSFFGHLWVLDRLCRRLANRINRYDIRDEFTRVLGWSYAVIAMLPLGLLLFGLADLLELGVFGVVGLIPCGIVGLGVLALTYWHAAAYGRLQKAAMQRQNRRSDYFTEMTPRELSRRQY